RGDLRVVRLVPGGFGRVGERPPGGQGGEEGQWQGEEEGGGQRDASGAGHQDHPRSGGWQIQAGRPCAPALAPAWGERGGKRRSFNCNEGTAGSEYRNGAGNSVGRAPWVLEASLLKEARQPVRR